MIGDPPYKTAFRSALDRVIATIYHVVTMVIYILIGYSAITMDFGLLFFAVRIYFFGFLLLAVAVMANIIKFRTGTFQTPNFIMISAATYILACIPTMILPGDYYGLGTAIFFITVTLGLATQINASAEVQKRFKRRFVILTLMHPGFWFFLLFMSLDPFDFLEDQWDRLPELAMLAILLVYFWGMTHLVISINEMAPDVNRSIQEMADTEDLLYSSA